MKLWEKDTAAAPRIESFTVGKDREMDLRLARYDVLGSLAHIRMLETIGLLTPEERKILAAELVVIFRSVEAETFILASGIEDIHSQVEVLLTRRLGDVGKKIHSGRSRNDQVLLDLRLYFRAGLEDIVQGMEGIFYQFQSLAKQHRHALMPGYTHFQLAMISSYGLWFGSWAESLAEDLALMAAVFGIINHNPLGSAAGYGSSFPLDRKMTTDLLGFQDLSYNVIHAQMGRGKSEWFLAVALASLGSTLGKFAMDVVLYSNPHYGLLSLPKECTTGSSIMPHKKNPDVFELLRGKCNALQALPGQVSLLTHNLPAGYHRDFQLLKEMVFPALDTALECLGMLAWILPRLEIHPISPNDPRFAHLFTVEKVNDLVLGGMPFRDAYRQVGEMVDQGTFEPNPDLHHVHEGSIGNLCLEAVEQKWEKVKKEFPFAYIAARYASLLRDGN